MALEFLIHGAMQGENSLFVSVTENSDKLLANIMPYRFFEDDLIKSGLLEFVDLPVMYERLGMTKPEMSMEEIDLLVAGISSIAKELGTKRLVIDSITSVCYKLKTSEKIRDFVLKLSKALSDLECTSILVSEVSAPASSYSMFGVEEAISDGIILMANMERRGDLLRTLQVIKMRGTMHSRAKYVLDLTPVGVLLVPLLKGGSSTK